MHFFATSGYDFLLSFEEVLQALCIYDEQLEQINRLRESGSTHYSFLLPRYRVCRSSIWVRL